MLLIPCSKKFCSQCFIGQTMRYQNPHYHSVFISNLELHRKVLDIWFQVTERLTEQGCRHWREIIPSSQRGPVSVLFGHQTHIALYRHHVMPSKYFKAFLEHFSNWQNSKKDFWLHICSQNVCLLLLLHFVPGKKSEACNQKCMGISGIVKTHFKDKFV